MSMPQPTKASVRNITLKGVDLRLHINKVSVYETITKPYLTAKLKIYDNNNLIDNMQLVGGEPCYFCLDAGDGKIYEANLNVLKVHGERSSQSLRTMVYDVDLIGPEYFKDKSSIVQHSFKGIPGTQAIQLLHSKFFGTGLRLLSQSLGPISKQSHIVSALKPFKAINDIRKKLLYAQYQTGNTLYYRDKEGHVLGPLEQLFSQLSPQANFIQKTTWGHNYFQDVVAAQYAIIAVQANVDFSDSGRGGMKNISAAKTQEKKVFDFRTKKLVTNVMASAVSPGKVIGSAIGLGAAIINSVAGGHGGFPNYMTMDSDHHSVQTHHSQKTERERLYNAMILDGPALTVKVPIQGGLDCTVGKGCNLNLIPSTGDINPGLTDASGLYLITDICHEVIASDQQMTGTTTFQCVRGGTGN